MRADEEMTPLAWVERAAVVFGVWAWLAGPFAATAAHADGRRSRGAARPQARARCTIDAPFRLRRACLRQQRRTTAATDRRLVGFAKCRPKESGLHEVYARFEDEDEYIGKAIDDPLYARGRAGRGWPGIRWSCRRCSTARACCARFAWTRFARPRTSAAWRICCGWRSSTATSRRWTCTGLPPAAGETPVGGIFVKQRCEKSSPERHLLVETRFLRKPGQSDADPATGNYRQGQFESWTRFEVFIRSIGVKMKNPALTRCHRNKAGGRPVSAALLLTHR